MKILDGMAYGAAQNIVCEYLSTGRAIDLRGGFYADVNEHRNPSTIGVMVPAANWRPFLTRAILSFIDIDERHPVARPTDENRKNRARMANLRAWLNNKLQPETLPECEPT